MSESVSGRHSKDHFIDPQNIDGVQAISLPNVITRISSGAERILGRYKAGESYPVKFVFPLNKAYSVLGNDETQKLRDGGRALLRTGANRHHHKDLTLTPPLGFTTEYAPGTLTYGIDAIRHVSSKGSGLAALSRDENGLLKTQMTPRIWYFDPEHARDAEASVRGLCSEKEADNDWWLSEKLNKRGGRFGIPLMTTKFTHLPAPRDMVEADYEGSYQVKLYPIEKLRRSRYKRIELQTLLPDFLGDEPHLEDLDDDEREEMTFGDPVDYERGFVSGIRIGDLSREPDVLSTRIQEMIRVIQREDSSVVDERSYLVWFVKKIANNLALLHSENLVHTQLNDEFLNITLGAEIVDNSGARPPLWDGLLNFAQDSGHAHGWERSHGRDRGAVGACLELLQKCRAVTADELFTYSELEKIFLREYTERIKEYYEQLNPKPDREPRWLLFARRIEKDMKTAPREFEL